MLKIIEVFGGIGSFTSAIKELNIEHNIVDYVDNNKYATIAYNLLNNTNFKPTNIKDWNPIELKVDIMIAGWPCQDFSILGKNQGLEGQRSGLIIDLLNKIKSMKQKPKHIILENVKGLLNRHKDQLEYIKNMFKEIGYSWNQKLINAKNYVPQNRERLFMLLSYKSDHPLSFDNWIESHKKPILKNIIDFKAPSKKSHNLYIKDDNKIILVDWESIHNREWKINKVAKTGTIKNNAFIQTIFGQDRYYYGIYGFSPTLLANNADFKNKIMWKQSNTIFFRKLTALECWRLMGFNENEFNRVSAISNTQLIKMAGNSIVKNIFVEIVKINVKIILKENKMTIKEAEKEAEKMTLNFINETAEETNKLMELKYEDLVEKAFVALRENKNLKIEIEKLKKKLKT